MLQSGANYLALALVWLSVHARNVRRSRRRQAIDGQSPLAIGTPAAPTPLLSTPAWAYALLALIDVEANACLVAAYRWTSITSVQLLDAWAIPAVLALSVLLLGRAYGRRQCLAAALCVLGFGVLVAFDARGAGAAAGAARRPWLGDALTLLGASLYAASNVLQERLVVGSTPRAELLGALGLFGALWSGAQGAALEGAAALRAPWLNSGVWLPVRGFGGARCAFFSRIS